MSDRLRALYPTTVDSTLVAPTFAVPRFPTAPQIRNETTVHNFYADRLLGEYAVTGTPDRIAVIDKLFPHSRFDAMILAANDETLSSTSDLAPTSLAVILDLACRFVDHVSDAAVIRQFGLDGSEIHLCFNYDRDTIDRENAMFYDKRFHLHLNCWPARDLGQIESARFGEISDPAVRRRLVDPVAILAASIIRDLAGTEFHGYDLDSDAPDDPTEPVGLKIRIGSWSALREPSLHKALRSLHDIADTAYRDIRTALVGTPEPCAPWTRHSLRPLSDIETALAAIPYLSDRNRQHLGHLASQLENLDETTLAACREDRELASRKMTLNGLDYSIGFYSRHGNTARSPIRLATDVTLTMQCRLLGDVGGAGLPPLKGHAAVRLDRRHGEVMTEAEIAERSDFHRQYLSAHLTPHLDHGTLKYLTPGVTP